MSGEEDEKPVNVDLRCIQEALRMFLQPIKNDDPRLDFFTMYKRETTEYDTDSMQKHNEDLNTTLIFTGLFSAVSSAFVIYIHSKLEPDSNERSEAYLRAILLSLNRSIVPDEDPAVPPVWKGPPAEIITTLNLLYASLLISLLAAFIAVLGKQWLSRYLRHAGGSMAERCGDRQRKFDGLEKWSFRLFMESLPVMLQIALLLLACGLSRYAWSVNTSVARVVISFTALGVLFYIGIVAAGTSSYECPFQTPASEGLRNLRDSGATRKLLAMVFPSKVISLVSTIWASIRQGAVLASYRVRGITSRIRSAATMVGHQTILLLLRIDRALGNAKQRLAQRIRRFRRAELLPTAVGDTHHRPGAPQNGPLLVRVRNLEVLRKQNMDNVRCVCWILRNITDPEAIDSAIRLAGSIRWFDGDPDHNPPLDLIVSTFEACFDSTKQLYPGMRDRAYFSARAILQISMRARVQSRGCASKYPIPEVSSDASQHPDPDLHHIMLMLKHNYDSERPTLDFPRAGASTSNHLLWVSNLFVDLVHVGPSPILGSYESYLSAAVTDHRATIANTLLMWHMFLGGCVEEETLWATDKSDYLEIILSCLSTRVINAIGDGDGLRHLNFLLEFLAAWENRPRSLTPMAYGWCSAISEVAGRLRPEPTLGIRCAVNIHLGSGFKPTDRRRYVRLALQDLASGSVTPGDAEREFSNIMPGTSDRTWIYYGMLLSISLEVGFRMVVSGHDCIALRLDRTPHHDLVLKAALLSRDDEVIADGLCAWIAGGDLVPAGSCMRYLGKRVGRDTPFSPRLRRMGIRAIERIGYSELMVPELEKIRLLNRLDIGVDDMEKKYEWLGLLVNVLYSPVGLEHLSVHYWHLLDRLALALGHSIRFTARDTELVELLEEAGRWEELEIWVAIAWSSPWHGLTPREVKSNLRKVTLKLLLQRPQALPRFEDLSNLEKFGEDQSTELRRICTRARGEQFPLETPPPPPPQPIID